MVRITEAHVPMAQGRIGLPPISFPNGLCNDALPPGVVFRDEDGNVVCSKESVLSSDGSQDWLARVAEGDGMLAFVEAKRIGLNAGTVLLLRQENALASP